MHNISWEALIARFVLHPGCGPNSIYTRIKLCENSFDLSLLDHSVDVLSTVHTARNLH